MLFISPLFSQASGSVAGLTFAHGRAGMTVRARSSPTNPDTFRQRAIKHILARLSPHWGDTLEQARRDEWNLYAANVVMTNVLGQPFHLTGQNHFLRANIPRIQSGISLLERAPTVFDLGTFTPPVLSDATELPPHFTISFDNSDDWATTDGGHMLIYEGRPTGPGREFFNGPYRFAALVDGDPIPPGSPVAVISVWRLITGRRLWVRIRIIQADGRLSLPIVLGPRTVAAT